MPSLTRYSPVRTRALVLLAGSCLAVTACAAPDGGGGAASSTSVAYEGARLILGDGSAPIEDGVMVVDGATIVEVGPRSAVQVPEGATSVDLSGKTVLPAIVNAHAHLAPDRSGRVDQLRHWAYYGTGLVASLGTDSGDDAFQVRAETTPGAARSLTAGRGITSPEPGRSDVPHWVTTVEEARAAVRELAAQQVDIVKIWVDDRNGQYERLSPELYGAVIDEAHANGLRVTAHVFTLEDAKGLLRAGIDAFAHGIRDRDIDDELLSLWSERPDVVLVPNLPNPGVASDLSWLGGTVPAAQLAEMQERAVDRPEAQESFGIQARNLTALHAAGVPIAFGTDGSSPWTAHQEMEDMVRAGMSPADVITAATSTSAEFMRMSDMGALAAGKSADFVVLNANPLDDITNTRRIDAVYLRGEAVDREALSARLSTGTSE